MRYVPIPTPDPDRPGQCQDCEGVCSGHYLRPDKLWQHANCGGELGKSQTPSDVILAVYREYKSVPSEAVSQGVARSVLLPCEEVKFWFHHLHPNSRKQKKRGTEKAQRHSNRRKSSRKEKKNTYTGKQRQTSSKVRGESDDDENVLCVVCDLHDPQSARNEMVSWVQCDGCLSWCHISCAELEKSNVPDRWLCLRCSEVW